MNIKSLILFINLINFATSSSFYCEYSITWNQNYQCRLSQARYSTGNSIDDIDGPHLSGKSADDVSRIVKSSKLNVFPSIVCEEFKNAQIMILNEANISKIDENSLENCKNLEEIDLRSNYVRKLSKNVFASQKRLRKLDLYQNEIEALPSGIFDALVNLEGLDLDFNKLSTLNSKLFRNLTKLKLLFLSRNEIEELPEKIFKNLISLEVLWIGGNKLKTIDSNSFGNHNGITEFNFAFNNIDSIDEDVFNRNMKYLRNISADTNPCVDVSGWIIDVSEERIKIFETLQKCFVNFNKLIGRNSSEKFQTLTNQFNDEVENSTIMNATDEINVPSKIIQEDELQNVTNENFMIKNDKLNGIEAGRGRKIFHRQ